MNQQEFFKLLAKIEFKFKEERGGEFVAIVEQMIAMLDETDGDDYFGTQGWRYVVGWE